MLITVMEELLWQAFSQAKKGTRAIKDFLNSHIRGALITRYPNYITLTAEYPAYSYER
jgi:hypothetical protein